jgi:hypothetical protein
MFENSCPICGIDLILKLENCSINYLVEEIILYIELDKKIELEEDKERELKKYFEGIISNI